MIIHGWGRYPRLDAEMIAPVATSRIRFAGNWSGSFIARGLGRSYGDSSLATTVLDTRNLDHFLDFDERTGVLNCAAGVTLDDILRTFVPRGWFLPVTPGTRFVTVGGAIASDVHGKNHHLAGCFGDHVAGIEVLLGNGERVRASREVHADLFRATCGGMGLTGVILSAAIRLQPIRSSAIVQTTLKCPDLESVLAAFEDNANSTYSVAWIDCLARGRRLGRSLLMLGEHAQSGSLSFDDGKAVRVSFDMPGGLLNPLTIGAFNWLYYARVLQERGTRSVSMASFFYPLDGIEGWNRMYGAAGFLQYQFVLPKTVGIAGLRNVLERIANAGQGSFLAVLKVFGKANEHLLSFPCEGYTLALDFKATPEVFDLLKELDCLVVDLGGRLYLAKDARMSEAVFKAGYPRWREFEETRERYHAIGHFASLQSQRLGLQ